MKTRGNPAAQPERPRASRRRQPFPTARRPPEQSIAEIAARGARARAPRPLRAPPAAIPTAAAQSAKVTSTAGFAERKACMKDSSVSHSATNPPNGGIAARENAAAIAPAAVYGIRVTKPPRRSKDVERARDQTAAQERKSAHFANAWAVICRSAEAIPTPARRPRPVLFPTRAIPSPATMIPEFSTLEYAASVRMSGCATAHAIPRTAPKAPMLASTNPHQIGGTPGKPKTNRRRP